MFDKGLIDKIRKLKEENQYTLYDLSRLTDVQVATISRWLKTNHINRVYAEIMRERLGLG